MSAAGIAARPRALPRHACELSHVYHAQANLDSSASSWTRMLRNAAGVPERGRRGCALVEIAVEGRYRSVAPGP